MDNTITACHQPNLGMTLHELAAELLRHAAPHPHDGARVDLPNPSKCAVHLLLRFFPHGTGIQKNHISVFQRALDKTTLTKGTRNPLGIVDVHLTPKGQTMKTRLRHIFF